ncbi:helix-turn-helix domain-containing protein [Nocardia sp. NPDC057272]|uniref:helix-turn-helix domain-containing protein n=1 Tax=Nocardia sp. NPDC057272 TaxID=3346079 RepID=UPI00363319A5
MGQRPLPETCYPSAASADVWLWIGHAVYRGPSLRLDRHSGSVHCLAVGVDGPFALHADSFGRRTVRSALIPPRTLHQVVAQQTRMLFCYIDPGSPRAHGCWEQITERVHEFGVHHHHETALIRLAARDDMDPAEVMDIACGPARIRLDPRIAAATAIVRAHPTRSITAEELAAEVQLSKSRLLHLFTEHAGTTFRRYRVWARMLAVGRAVAKGADLTTAAADAGFASPSHFSDTFHAMCGLSATDLLSTGARINVLD